MEPAQEIAETRDQVEKARANLANTADELKERVAAPVRAVREKLDVVQLVKDHPWPAVAVAMGVGAFIAASEADKRAAQAVAEKARDAGAAGVRIAREAPSKTSAALHTIVDSVALKLGLSVLDSLRRSETNVSAAERSAPSTSLD